MESSRRPTTKSFDPRLVRLRAFRNLRRRLRQAEDESVIAEAAHAFAMNVVGCTHFALYAAEKDDSDFQLLKVEGDPATELVLPGTLDRSDSRIAKLAEGRQSAATAQSVQGHYDNRALPPLGSSPEEAALKTFLGGARSPMLLSLRGTTQEDRLIGIIIAAGSDIDGELLDEVIDEVAFDVESALASKMMGRLRAEELAVLEIQERELVGLLRDVEARDEIIQRDLEEARQFQRKMLGSPPVVKGASIEVVYQPVGLVGGDLYAVSLLGDPKTSRRLRVFVADATGHGVRASLTTMFIKSGYEAIRQDAEDPATVLSALNDAIAQTYRSSEMLFSAICADIDLATGRVLTSSAAHCSFCVVRAGQAALVEGGGAFLGLRTGMKFSIEEVHLAKGDGIYLYTDGYIEARKGNEQFGEPRLCDTLRQAHLAGRKAGNVLEEAVRAFLGETAMDDDATFVGVRVGIDDPDPPGPAVSIHDLD